MIATFSVIGQNPGSLEVALPEVKQHVMFDVVTWQLAKRRAGTASTKTRANVSKTGKKKYSQKGTGNARHGDGAAPIFVGGGTAHGPHPRDYSYTLPKKVRKLGLAMAVADRAEQGKVVAVDGFGLEPKTKSFLAWAKANGMDGSERVFLVTDDENALRAARNLIWVTPVKTAGLNCYDVLRHERLLIDRGALEACKLERANRDADAPKPEKKAKPAPEAAKPQAVKAAPVDAPKPVAKVEAPKVEAVKATPVETPVAAPVVEAPVVEAPKAAAPASTPDDLKKIEGIGPKINDALIAAGIDTFAKLENASEESLKAALETAGLRFAPSLGTWAEQSGFLVRGDEAGFKALTDSLTAGRKEGDA
jgi:large subunit ribosomal protein L4